VWSKVFAYAISFLVFIILAQKYAKSRLVVLQAALFLLITLCKRLRACLILDIA